MAHNVAYIVSGTLVSQTLSKNADGTYSGTVTVSVARTNRHAAAAKGMTETYTLTDAHLTFALRDTNNDGSVGLDDLAAGDRVKAIGKITTLSKRSTTRANSHPRPRSERSSFTRLANPGPST